MKNLVKMMKTFDCFNIDYTFGNYDFNTKRPIFRDFADFYLSVITHTVLVKIFDLMINS